MQSVGLRNTPPLARIAIGGASNGLQAVALADGVGANTGRRITAGDRAITELEFSLLLEPRGVLVGPRVDVINSNAVLTYNQTFVPGGSWLAPTSVLTPRFFKLSAQIDF